MLLVEESTGAKPMNQVRAQDTLTLGVVADEAGGEPGKGGRGQKQGPECLTGLHL